MSLITNVMDHSLDDGYAEAAARKRAQGEAGGMPKTLRARLGLAGGLVLAALVVTVGAAQARVTAPVVAKERQELIDRIDRETAAADKLETNVDKLRDDVSARQRAALKDSGGSGQADLVDVLSGATAVHGPGVKLVVNDAKEASSGGDAGNPRETSGFSDTGRVRDHDMQRVVNGLWASGAEAISINGQRLTALSAIRAAGTRYWSTTGRWYRRTRCWRWETGRGSAPGSRTAPTACICTPWKRTSTSGRRSPRRVTSGCPPRRA